MRQYILMDVIERKLQKYETNDGKCPYDEWIKKVKDKRTRIIIAARLTRLELGNLGRYRDLGDGVKELKIDFGPGFRVYFAEATDVIVLLLCGGIKRTQDQDIENAKHYWSQFKEREND